MKSTVLFCMAAVSLYAAIEIDPLFWKADEDGLEYARRVKVLQSDQGGFTPSSSSLSKTFSVEGKWSPGVRIGVGCRWRDPWDFAVIWTSFSSKSKASQGNFNAAFDPNYYYAPIWHPFLAQRTSTALERWKLRYNTVDLEVGDTVAFCRCTLRPHAGLRAARIKQDIVADYNGAWPLSEGFAQRRTKFAADNNFKGIGLRTGIDTCLQLCEGWSVTSQSSITLLYGKFHVVQTIQGFQQNSLDAIPSPYNNIKTKNMPRTRANLQAFLGLTWTSPLKSKCTSSFTIGYEILEWFQQNETSQTLVTIVGDGGGNTFFSETRQDADLALQGLTLKGSLRF